MAKHDKVGPFRILPNKARNNYILNIPAHLSESGRRERPSFPTKREAVIEAKNRVRMLTQKVFGKPNAGKKRTGTTLHQLSIAWLENRQKLVGLRKLKPATLETQIHYLGSLTKHIGHQDIGLIREAEIEDYQAIRLNEGRSPSTINSEVSLLKSMLRWISEGENKLIDDIPKITSIAEDELIPDLPTIDEMQRIIECIHPDKRVLLLLMAETGCRKSEAQTLPWKHVNEVQGTIKFQRFENADGDVWNTKRKSSVREVPITKELLHQIRSLEKVSEYVFPGRNDKSKPINNFRKSLKTAIRKSGVERNCEPIHITPQIIRKAVLTWHVEQGTPESVAQALCGHAKGSRVTQKVYINHQQAAIAKALIPMSSPAQTENKSNEDLATNGNKPKKQS